MRWTLVGALTLAPMAAGAQQSPSTYLVRQGDKEIGRERVTVSGTTITVDARYPGSGTTVEASLEREPQGGIASFRLRATGPASGTILAATSGGRLIVRSQRGGAETTREVPGGRSVVLLDENALALYAALAELATPGGTRITAYVPRTGNRLSLTARRTGTTVEFTGDQSGTLTLDSEGRLERLELPAQRISVARIAG